eukprot:837566-Prymnesium_polylepis.1
MFVSGERTRALQRSPRPGRSGRSPAVLRGCCPSRARCVDSAWARARRKRAARPRGAATRHGRHRHPHGFERPGAV